MNRPWHRESRTEPALLREGIARCARRLTSRVLPLTVLQTCVLVASAVAQSLELNQYAHRSWRPSDLALAPGAQRTKFAQTPDGYLWLGTIVGLYRFDGVRAVRFKGYPDGEKLKSVAINSLHSSRDGTLWIAGDSGLVSLRDGKLTAHPSFIGQQVTRVFEDSRGVLWLGVRDNTWKLHGVAPRLCAIRTTSLNCERDARFGSTVRDILEDRGGNLWVVSSTGVWRWAPGSPQYYPITAGLTSIPTFAVEDEDGAIITGSEDGLARFENGAFRPYNIPGVRGRFVAGKLFRSRDGSLWISSLDYGLYHLHRGRVDRFTAADGLSSDQVHGFFEDRDGNVWVDTGNGIDQFRPVAAPRLPSTVALSSATVWSVLATPDSSVWLATPTGLNQWKNGKVTVFADASPNRSKIASSDTDSKMLRPVPNGDAHSPVYSLGMENSGRVWASTRQGMVRQMGRTFVPIRGGLPGPAHSLASDSKGNFWVNHEFIALFRWAPNDTLRRVLQFTENGKYTISALAADARGTGVWASQQYVGLVYVDSVGIRSTYAPVAGRPGSPANQLRMAADEVLWSASANGLTRIKERRSATLSSKNGLPCDFVHWSIEDDQEWIWMRLSCGLVRVAKAEVDAWVRDSSRNVIVQRFGRYAAMTDDQYGAKYYTRPAVTKATDGRIWFADVEGGGVIDPRLVRYNDRAPPVYVEQITADSVVYELASRGKDAVRIAPRVRNVRIDFTAPTFTFPERVRFRFMLEGQDAEWREVVNQRRAEYSNLAPGTYRFRVTAANSDGVWNANGTSVSFTVAPAWNQTWWFFTIIAAAIAAGAASAAGAWQHRRSRLVSERQQFQFDATLAERTRVARELHDTLLGDMAGMAMQLSAGAKAVGASRDPDSGVIDLLSALSKQVQHSLVDARRAVTAMRTGTPGEVTLLHTQIELAAGRTFARSQIVANVEVVGSPRQYPAAVENEVLSMVTESMLNARHHAKCEAVTVTCRYALNELRVTVRDDGCGFDASQPPPSGHWGLTGMRERAASINAALSITSSAANGTEVIIRLPVDPH